MKCGIITYHFANNYGAVLQCLALKTAIEKQGHIVEVINFVSEKQADNNSLYRKKQGIKGYVKNILLIPFRKRRKIREKKFQCFRENLLKCDTGRIKTKEELESYIKNSRFNVIISGSDQVWNPNVFDFEDAFFYPFAVDVKKVGYAVSLGSTTVSQLSKFQKWIDQFDVITVRELKSANILEQLTNKKIEEVCDPVLLLKRSDWNKFLIPAKERGMVCYFVREEDLKLKINKAKELAKELRLNLKIINMRITKANLTNDIAYDLSPIEFLSEIANADYVYTDSFHGTVFSLIFEKEFTTVESKSESTDSRKRNILEKVGLLDRIKEVDKSSDRMCHIDYSKISPKIDFLREESNIALKNMLKIDS